MRVLALALLLEPPWWMTVPLRPRVRIVVAVVLMGRTVWTTVHRCSRCRRLRGTTRILQLRPEAEAEEMEERHIIV